MKPKNVEDMYPLSPMQQGMLFHARYAPEAAQYFVQWAAVLRGELHVPLFQEAWQSVIDHPPIATRALCLGWTRSAAPGRSAAGARALGRARLARSFRDGPAG